MKKYKISIIIIFLLLLSCQSLNQKDHKIIYNDIVLTCERNVWIIFGSSISSIKLVEDKIFEGSMSIEITFTGAGANTISEITQKNINRQLSISVAGRIILAAKIGSPITNGRIRIDGFSKEEVNEIINTLSSVKK